jgi:hypothetical protein
VLLLPSHAPTPGRLHSPRALLQEWQQPQRPPLLLQGLRQQQVHTHNRQQ